MAAKPSKIVTDLQPDPPLALTATTPFDALDRQYIDTQVRGCEQHLAANLINGVVATWAKVASGSATIAAGDVLCLASTATAALVTLATPSALAIALSPYGVALTAAAPGSKVLVAIAGLVVPSLTGLGGTSGFVRVSTLGRCERVASLAAGDYPLGTADAQGYLTLGGAAGTAIVSLLSGSAPANVTRSAASAGVSMFASRDDHKHDILIGDPVEVGSVLSAGFDSALALANHVHTLGAFITIGVAATAADAGEVRFQKRPTIAARNEAGSGNITILSVDASQNVIVGQQAAEPGNLFLRAPTAGFVEVFQGATLLAFYDISGLDLRCASLLFGAAVTAPLIYQADTESATGQALEIHAQNGATTGGNLDLRSGTGATDAGNVTLRRGSQTVLTLGPSEASFANPIAVGATPATTGSLRLPDSGGVYASTANIGLILHAGTDTVNLAAGAELLDVLAKFPTFTMANTGYLSATIDGSEVLKIEETQTTFHSAGSANIGFFATPSAGGGVGVIFAKDATTVPTSNPTAGGILYSQGGAGKWRSSSGTTTTFAPAEPHCARCGRDFAHEWENDQNGEHLMVCIPCMIGELGRLGADITNFASFNTLRKG